MHKSSTIGGWTDSDSTRQKGKWPQVLQRSWPGDQLTVLVAATDGTLTHKYYEGGWSD